MKPLVLDSTQRRYLKQLAHPLKPLLQIGKEGPSEAFIRQLNEQLAAHELIKVRILDNCMTEKEEIRTRFERAGVTVVQKVGHVFTVFRQKEIDTMIPLPGQKD